jgi:hypothetical protein
MVINQFYTHLDMNISKSISNILHIMCDVNDPTNASIFTGSYLPAISLTGYIERLIVYFDCPDSIQIAAMILINRFCEISGATVNKLSIHRILSIAFIIATKYLIDIHYTNNYYSIVCCIDLKELNTLELSMLQYLNYDVHITSDMYYLYYEKFIEHIENLELLCDEEFDEDMLLKN